MRRCSFCGDQNVVLISGYSYCPKCLGPKERREIDAWASQVCIMNGNLKRLLVEMFRTNDYRFSAFENLYDRWPRGGWSEKSGFQIDQKTYLQSCLRSFIKQRGSKA